MIHCFINPLAVRRHRDGIFCLRNVYPSSEFTGMRPTNAPWRTLLPIHVYTCMRIYMAGKPELPNIGLHTVTQLLAVVVWINKSSTTRNYTWYEYVALVDSRPRRPLQVAGIVVSWWLWFHRSNCTICGTRNLCPAPYSSKSHTQPRRARRRGIYGHAPNQYELQPAVANPSSNTCLYVHAYVHGWKARST